MERHKKSRQRPTSSDLPKLKSLNPTTIQHTPPPGSLGCITTSTPRPLTFGMYRVPDWSYRFQTERCYQLIGAEIRYKLFHLVAKMCEAAISNRTVDNTRLPVQFVKQSEKLSADPTLMVSPWLLDSVNDSVDDSGPTPTRAVMMITVIANEPCIVIIDEHQLMPHLMYYQIKLEDCCFTTSMKLHDPPHVFFGLLFNKNVFVAYDLISHQSVDLHTRVKITMGVQHLQTQTAITLQKPPLLTLQTAKYTPITSQRQTFEQFLVKHPKTRVQYIGFI